MHVSISFGEGFLKQISRGALVLLLTRHSPPRVYETVMQHCYPGLITYILLTT